MLYETFNKKKMRKVRFNLYKFRFLSAFSHVKLLRRALK